MLLKFLKSNFVTKIKVMMTNLVLNVLIFIIGFSNAINHQNLAPKNIILKELPKNPKIRPNSLINEEIIECQIYDLCIVFNLPKSINCASVNIYNDYTTWFDFISQGNNIMNVSIPSGSNIELYADDGRIFFGKFDLHNIII